MTNVDSVFLVANGSLVSNQHVRGLNYISETLRRLIITVGINNFKHTFLANCFGIFPDVMLFFLRQYIMKPIFE